MCLYCLSSSCVLCTQCYQSIHSRQKFQLAYWGKKNIYYRWPTFFEVFLIFSPNFWKFKWLWSILDLHFSFLTGTWVQDFFFIKISYLECMFNFRTPWHVLLLFYAILTFFTNCPYIYKMYHLFNFWKMSIWPNIVIHHARGL